MTATVEYDEAELVEVKQREAYQRLARDVIKGAAKELEDGGHGPSERVRARNLAEVRYWLRDPEGVGPFAVMCGMDLEDIAERVVRPIVEKGATVVVTPGGPGTSGSGGRLTREAIENAMRIYPTPAYAAEALEVNPSSLHRAIRNLGIPKPEKWLNKRPEVNKAAVERVMGARSARQAARKLGVGRDRLHEEMQKYGIARPAHWPVKKGSGADMQQAPAGAGEKR